MDNHEVVALTYGGLVILHKSSAFVSTCQTSMHLISNKNYSLLTTYCVLGILPTLSPIVGQPYKAGVACAFFTEEEAEGHRDQAIHLSTWRTCNGVGIQPN